MAVQPRSLRHEYDSWVDSEIENYKDSIPRSALLRIGDEAVARIRANPQGGFGELLICVEVDQIIRQRLRLPSYASWRRRRMKMLEAWRRPEHWGLAPDTPLVSAIRTERESHVLVLGNEQQSTTLFLAANGCQITTIDDDPDLVERVIMTAGQAGLASSITVQVSPLGQWFPAEPLHAVVSSPAAFERLSFDERRRVIEILKSATLDGGVHLVRTLAAGQQVLDVEELRERYSGWDIAIVEEGSAVLARKCAVT